MLFCSLALVLFLSCCVFHSNKLRPPPLLTLRIILVLLGGAAFRGAAFFTSVFGVVLLSFVLFGVLPLVAPFRWWCFHILVWGALSLPLRGAVGGEKCGGRAVPCRNNKSKNGISCANRLPSRMEHQHNSDANSASWRSPLERLLRRKIETLCELGTGLRKPPKPSISSKKAFTEAPVQKNDLSALAKLCVHATYAGSALLKKATAQKHLQAM